MEPETNLAGEDQGRCAHSRGPCLAGYRLETEASGLEISLKAGLKFGFALMVGVLLAIAAVDVYRWLAWNVLKKDFEAVCTLYPELTGKDTNQYRVVEGPYTQEFWAQLRIAYTKFPRQLKPEWAMWQEDGTLRVPVGFDFTPDDSAATYYFHDDPRRREYSQALSASAAYHIRALREAGGADFSHYSHLAFSRRWTELPPSLPTNTCGFMEQFITVGGAFAGE